MRLKAKVKRKSIGKIPINVGKIRAAAGFFEDAPFYPSKQTQKGTTTLGAKVTQVAEWQEFGTKNIPPRPFMRPTIADNQMKWLGIVNRMLHKEFQSGKPSILPPFKKIAKVMQRDLQKAILELEAPPLHKATINSRRKRRAAGEPYAGFPLSKPLIDTGLLISSLKRRVFKGEKEV